MASPAVFHAIDTYARIYQHFIRLPVEWNIEKQNLVYVSKKSELIFWYAAIGLEVLAVFSTLLLNVSHVYTSKNNVPLWVLLFEAGLGLLGAVTCSVAIHLVLYGENLVFACNILILTNKQVPNGKHYLFKWSLIFFYCFMLNRYCHL